MSLTFQTVLIVNALFFIIYGIQAIRSEIMITEFRRFGLSDVQRKLTGVLQVAGSAGLLSGLFVPHIGFLAAAGLTAMMLVAFIVRLKIRDNLVQSLPSVLFMLINAGLTFCFYNLLV